MIALLLTGALSMVAPSAHTDPRRCAVAAMPEHVSADRGEHDYLMVWTDTDRGHIIGYSRQEDGAVYVRRADLERCAEYR